MTDNRLADIERRAAAATPGPWELDVSDPEDVTVLRKIPEGVEYVGGKYKHLTNAGWGPAACTPCDKADWEFIAHARQDIPYLLELVEKQRIEDNAKRRLLNIAEDYRKEGLAQNERLVESVTKKGREIGELRHKVLELETKLKDQGRNSCELFDEAREQQSRAYELEQQLAAKDAEIDQYKSNIESLRQHIASEVEKADQRLVEDSKDVDRVLRICNAKDAEIDQLKETLEDSLEVCGDNTKMMKNLSAEAIRLMDVLDEKDAEIERLTLELLKGTFDIDSESLEKWKNGEDQLKATNECLSLAEIRRLAPESRIEHVRGCGFCKDIIGTKFGVLPFEKVGEILQFDDCDDVDYDDQGEPINV